MDRSLKIKELTVNIHALGKISGDIDNWYWKHYLAGEILNEDLDLKNDKDFRHILTNILLVTDDKELDTGEVFEMSLEDSRNLLVKKHFEYLNKFREELISL